MSSQQWCYSKVYVVAAGDWAAFVERFKSATVPRLAALGLGRMRVWSVESGEDHQLLIFIPISDGRVVERLAAADRLSGTGEVWDPGQVGLVKASSYQVMTARPELGLPDGAGEAGDARFDEWLLAHIRS